MAPVNLRHLPRLSRLRRLAAGWCAAGLPLFGWGCTQVPAGTTVGPAPLVARAAGAEPVIISETPVIQGPVAPVAPETAPAGPVPISLDTVLRLAQGQNAQVGVARTRVREAFAEKTANPRSRSAKLRWARRPADAP